MRSSIKASINLVFVAAAVLFCAIVLILIAFNLLATAGVAALVSTGFDSIWAGLAVGLGMMAAALLLIKTAMMLLARAKRSLAQPVQNLGLDTKAIKDAYHAE